MIANRSAEERFQRILGIVEKELRHLLTTDRRLFAEPFTMERAVLLEKDDDLAERTEAFVSRFGRLQDTVGDKLLPAYLAAHGENTATFIDNLDRAERLNLINDAQSWIDMRYLRNQMIHEYVEDPLTLATALQQAHEFIPTLTTTVERFIALRSA